MVILAIVFSAIFAPAVAPYDPNSQQYGFLEAPTAAHWFGTDHFGRDIFSMIMVGARNSIAVAIVAVGVGMGIGVPLGCWAAARGGFVDEALMRFNDLIFAFPALLSAVMITAIFGPGAVNAIIAIGIFNIPVFARVARAGALALILLAWVSLAAFSPETKKIVLGLQEGIDQIFIRFRAGP